MVENIDIIDKMSVTFDSYMTSGSWPLNQLLSKFIVKRVFKMTYNEVTT